MNKYHLSQYIYQNRSNRITSSSSNSSLSPTPSSTSSTENAVSSRGCHRLFIILVLEQALKYCQSLTHSPDFPFSSHLIRGWIIKAHRDCTQLSHESSSTYGGIPFLPNNPTSYWSEPKQFYTWWKNNIERRNKFSNLQRDAGKANNEKNLLRAYYCRTIVDLTNNIRNHFEKNRIMQENTSHPGPQVSLISFDNFCKMIQEKQRLYMFSNEPQEMLEEQQSNGSSSLGSETTTQHQQVKEEDEEDEDEEIEREEITTPVSSTIFSTSREESFHYQSIHDDSQSAFIEYDPKQQQQQQQQQQQHDPVMTPPSSHKPRPPHCHRRYLPTTTSSHSSSSPAVNNYSNHQQRMYNSMMKGEGLSAYYNSWKDENGHGQDQDEEDEEEEEAEDGSEREFDVMREIFQAFHEDCEDERKPTHQQTSRSHTRSSHKDKNKPSWQTIRPSPIEIDSKKVKKEHVRRNSREKSVGYAYQRQDVTEIPVITPRKHQKHQIVCSPITTTTPMKERDTLTPKHRTFTHMVQDSQDPLPYPTTTTTHTTTGCEDSSDREFTRIETPLKSPKLHSHHRSHHHHNHNHSFFASSFSEFDSEYPPIVHFDPLIHTQNFNSPPSNSNSNGSHHQIPDYLHSIKVDLTDYDDQFITISPLTLIEKVTKLSSSSSSSTDAATTTTAAASSSSYSSSFCPQSPQNLIDLSFPSLDDETDFDLFHIHSLDGNTLDDMTDYEQL